MLTVIINPKVLISLYLTRNNYWVKSSILGYLLVSILTSCADKSSTILPEKNVLKVLKPSYAKGFEVHFREKELDIILFNLEKPGDTLKIISLPNPPSVSTLAACMSTTHLPFMDALKLENLVSACGNAQWVKNDKFKALINSGQILNLTTGDALDIELLLASGAKILFTYPFGDTYIDTKKIRDITVIPISEYLEEDPLGRAEWIRFFGAIYGKSEMADSIFSSIENSYQEIKMSSQTDSSLVLPKVLTASVQGDRWFVPPGNSYIGHLLKDAGGDFLFADSIATSNYSFDQEGFFELLMKSDVYTEVTMDSSLESLENFLELRPVFKVTPVFENHRIYLCNSSKTDYFGDAVLEPHILIQDLSSALYPSRHIGYKPKYFELIKP
jgi:iron complex transport system substrate-binding protein